MDSREYSMRQRRTAKAAAEKGSKKAGELSSALVPAIVPPAPTAADLEPIVSLPAAILSERDRCSQRNAAFAAMKRLERDYAASARISRAVAGKIAKSADNGVNAESFFAWKRGAWARSMQYYYQVHGRARVYRPFDESACPECGRRS